MADVKVQKNEVLAGVYQTIMSSPGMQEKCRLSLTLSRQNTLVLARIIEAGILAENNPLNDLLIDALPAESLQEFGYLHEEILKKTLLSEFYTRLKNL